MKSYRAILFVCFAIWLVGCKTRRIPEVPIRTDSVYIEKLVPYALPPDSASITALMECDENGKVVLRWLDLANSENVQLRFKLDSLGNVSAKMIVPKDTAFIPGKDIKTTKEIPVYIEARLTKWEQIKMDFGGWAFAALSGIILLTLLRIVRIFINSKK